MGRSAYLLEFGVEPGGMRLGMVDAVADIAALRSSIESHLLNIRGTGRPPGDDDEEPDGLELVRYGFRCHLWQVHRGHPARVTDLCKIIHIRWGRTRMPLGMLFSLQKLGHGPSTARDSWNGQAVSLDVPWAAVESVLLPLEGKALEDGQSVCLSMQHLPTGVEVPEKTHLYEGGAIFFGANDLEFGLEDPELNPTAFRLNQVLLEAEDQGRLEAATTEVLFSALGPGDSDDNVNLICREYGEQKLWVRSGTGNKAPWIWTTGDHASVLAQLPETLRGQARDAITSE